MVLLRSEGFAAFALIGFTASVILFKSMAMNFFLLLLLLVFIMDRDIWSLHYWSKIPSFSYYWIVLASFGIVSILWTSTLDGYLLTGIKKLRFYILVPILIAIFYKLKNWSKYFLTIISLILILNLFYALFNGGGLYDRIFFGFTSAILLSLSLNALIQNREIVFNLFLLVLTLVGVLVVEDSRGSLLSTFAVVTYFLFVSIFYSSYTTRKMIFFFVLTGFLAIILLTYLGYLDRFLQLSSHISNYVNGEVYRESFIERAEYIRFGLSGFMENPIFGNGLGSYPMLALKYNNTSFDWGVVTNPHSQYTLILSELGIVGLIFYISFFISFLSGKAQLDKSIVHLAVASLILVLVASVYDSVFFDQRTGYLLIILLSFFGSEMIKKGS